MELEDLLFDAPPFGQELPFLDGIDSEQLYANEELGDTSESGVAQFVAYNEAEKRLTDKLGKRVKAEINPQLKSIVKMLKQGRLQTEATNEHNVINNTAAFRTKVLKDLYSIAVQLPRNHPVRQQIISKLGLL